MDETRDRLQNIFRDVFDDLSIILQDEMSAEDIEEWDSLTHIQLIVSVENEFCVEFETAEIVELKNVGDFITLIQKKIRNKQK
jgi:acyl carrier protein